jgi:hypothetical protein
VEFLPCGGSPGGGLSLLFLPLFRVPPCTSGGSVFWMHGFSGSVFVEGCAESVGTLRGM